LRRPWATAKVTLPIQICSREEIKRGIRLPAKALLKVEINSEC
jgi:hypothetical protein